MAARPPSAILSANWKPKPRLSEQAILANARHLPQPGERETVDLREIGGYNTTLSVRMKGARTPVAAESAIRLSMLAPGDKA
jgi:hypothetical protein